MYEKVSDREGRTPTTESLDTRGCHHSGMLVNSGALIRWTADENMIMNGLTKDHKESRQHVVRALQNGEWIVQRDAALVRRKPTTKLEETSTRPCPVKLHDESNLVENARKLFFWVGTVSSLHVFDCDRTLRIFISFFFVFLNSETRIAG